MNPGYNGRNFKERDTAGAREVAMVNETFQRRFFPHESPLGRHIGWGDSGPTNKEIVGVVKDIKQGDLKEKPKPWTFAATLQNPAPGAVTFYLRTARNPLSVAQAARQGVRLEDG